MIELCDQMLEFYPKEIEKVAKRLKFFEDIRKNWEEKRDHDSD